MFNPSTEHPAKFLQMFLETEISSLLKGLSIVTKPHESFDNFDFDIDIEQDLKSRRSIPVRVGSEQERKNLECS